MIEFDENKTYTTKEIAALFGYESHAFTGKTWESTQRTLSNKGYNITKINQLNENNTSTNLFTIKKGTVNTEIFYEDLPNEEWVDTYCCSEVEISNFGRVRNKKTHRRHKGTIDKKTGYITVSIKDKMYRLHRLVFKSFYPEYLDSKDPIDHIDGNKSNNKLDNLRITSILTNTHYMFVNRSILQQAITEKLNQGYNYQELLEIINNLPNKLKKNS